MAPIIRHKIKTALAPFIFAGLLTGVFVCVMQNNWHPLNMVFGFAIGGTVFFILYSYTDYFYARLTRRFNLIVSVLLLTLFYAFVIYTVSLFYAMLSNIRYIDVVFKNFSRIMEACKKYKTDMIISGQAFKLLKPDPRFSNLGPVALRGKTAEINLLGYQPEH